MANKFLVFSCLVLLISIVYFIYTSYQLHIENKNQQEMTVELGEPFVERVSTSSSSQSPKPERSNPEPTAEEWEAFEEVFRDFEDSEEQTETTQSEIASETEDSHTGISPELEAMFTRVRDIQTQENVLIDEVADLYIEESEIQARQIEIGTKELLIADTGQARRLHEELKMLHDRRVELDTILNPYDEQIEGLNHEFEQEYGMSTEEFHEGYDSVYKSWIENS